MVWSVRASQPVLPAAIIKEKRIVLTSKLSKVVANVEGLIVVVGIFVIDEGDGALLGVVDDVGQQEIIVAEDNWAADIAQLSLQQCVLFLQLALRRYQLQEPAKSLSQGLIHGRWRTVKLI
jgi:hypothetical protein